MNAGRLLIGGLVLTALVAGAAMYYLQVYAYYDRLTPDEVGPVAIQVAPGTPLSIGIRADAMQAIDSDSSPIRFRACFDTDPAYPGAAQPYPDPEPLVAPGWFDCFDAAAIGAALEEDRARAFLAQENVTYGIDRVMAIFPDGRGFMWHQINPCGEAVFDGDPAPEGCPPVPERLQ